MRFPAVVVVPAAMVSAMMTVIMPMAMMVMPVTVVVNMRGPVVWARVDNRRGVIDRSRRVTEYAAAVARHIGTVIPAVIHEVHHPVTGAVAVAMAAPEMRMLGGHMHVDRLSTVDAGIAHDRIRDQEGRLRIAVVDMDAAVKAGLPHAQRYHALSVDRHRAKCEQGGEQ